MYTLGIETSCDETACAILENYNVLSNVTVSSLGEHRRYGGVVPEIATRAHLKNIDKVLSASLSAAGIPLKRVDAIAVTYKPGLVGALVVGTSFAKSLSLALSKPLIGINHLAAHLFAPFLNYKHKLQFPFLGVVISGGHTELYRVDDFDKIRVLGRTPDDACGEVFDKVARALGLGYPGGPVIDRLFNPRYKTTFKFKCGKNKFDLSFSGIKTAVIYKKIEMEKIGALDRKMKVKLVSSFQYAALEAVITVVLEAARQLGINTVVCGGGVTANNYLRARLSRPGPCLKFLLSPREYAGDNAAIVAGLGFYLYNRKGIKSNMNLAAEAN